MAIRANKLLSELNIGLQTLSEILKELGHDEEYITPSTKLSDGEAEFVRALFSDSDNLFNFIGKTKKRSDSDSVSPLKILGKIDLDEINRPRSILKRNVSKPPSGLFAESPIKYSEDKNFWIEELAVLNPTGEVTVIGTGNFVESEGLPLYSVLIGTNGVGKSTLMKELVDFFIDLHACLQEDKQKHSIMKTGQLRGVKYHIDGVRCEVVRWEKSYIAKINGMLRKLSDLRLPSMVACHFGAFEKFPTQKANGATLTRYDVPYYKYVGAHVNGSMISSPAIAFRLLFALNERMNECRRQNIRAILDFIGYDHRLSLQYSFVAKSKKNGAVRESIAQRVEKDREYVKLSKQKRNAQVAQLYSYYKTKTASGKTQYSYDVDFDNDNEGDGASDELNTIYKLRQYDFVNSPNVLFYKQGAEVSSDGLSSGEFAMLSTVLSVTAAANAPHTLIMLDEPELSLHPNWQMTLIDNLDMALKGQVCHLLIATHSHMVVSDLPMKRSSVTQLEKDEKGDLKAAMIADSTYGWSAEEVLLKVFKTATDRNRYFGERIGKLLEQMGNNTISPKDVASELKDLQEISNHLSDVDPMKVILNTIVESYK